MSGRAVRRYSNPVIQSQYSAMFNPISVLWNGICQIVNRSLSQQLQDANIERDRLRDERDDLDDKLKVIRKRSKDRGKEINELRDKLRHVRERTQSVRERTQSVREGTIWRTPCDDSTPALRPLAQSSPPIVAVANLKGGVGKTTITANLAAAYWNTGKRVLLVDLDYQGSLTLLTLTSQERRDVRNARRWVDGLLHHEPKRLSEIRTRIGYTNAMLVACDEEFHDFELRMLVDWIQGETVDDPRFFLRRVLHSDATQTDYDLVLLDCPPRLTPGCVNALASADLIVVPVSPDALSVEAVPRMLKSLRDLRHAGVCSDTLGVAILRNKDKSQTSPWQADIWRRVEATCRDSWDRPVRVFDTAIPWRIAFAKALEESRVECRFPALGEFSKEFQELRSELDGITSTLTSS